MSKATLSPHELIEAVFDACGSRDPRSEYEARAAAGRPQPQAAAVRTAAGRRRPPQGGRWPRVGDENGMFSAESQDTGSAPSLGKLNQESSPRPQPALFGNRKRKRAERPRSANAQSSRFAFHFYVTVIPFRNLSYVM